MLRRRWFTFVLAGMLALAGILPSTAAAQEAPSPESAATEGGNGFVRHQAGPFWVWFGPQSWTGSGSANGLTIFGTGGAVLDTGFSSILCANGATYPQSVTNYFAQRRNQLRNQGYTLLSATNIVRPAGTGPSYRRQQIQWRRTSGGATRRGFFEFDYDCSQNVDGINYCFARNLGLYSLANTWASRRPILIQINQRLAYSGPGACDPSPSTPC